MMKSLGHNWQRLRLVYLVAGLGVVHYWWLAKKDITLPLIYACVLAILLSMRLPGFSPHSDQGK